MYNIILFPVPYILFNINTCTITIYFVKINWYNVEKENLRSIMLVSKTFPHIAVNYKTICTLQTKIKI